LLHRCSSFKDLAHAVIRRAHIPEKVLSNLLYLAEMEADDPQKVKDIPFPFQRMAAGDDSIVNRENGWEQANTTFVRR
jgi:hypothetical protein